MSTQGKNVLIDDEYVKDADLLAAARDIFGLIVIKAEHRKYGFDYQDDKHLRFDSSDLRLTFKDGRVIEFWNSEWGGIKRVDDLALPPADQWIQEEQAKFTEEDKPVIVFNHIGAFVNFAKGMEIKQNNGTISDNDRKLLEQLDMAVIKGTSTAINMSAIPLVMTDEQIAALDVVKGKEITMPDVNVPAPMTMRFYEGERPLDANGEPTGKLLMGWPHETVNKDADEKTIEIGAKIIDNAYMRAFAEMIVEKSTSGIRIILDERVKDKLKEGHKFEIGDGRELALDENGDLTIRNTSMV